MQRATRRLAAGLPGPGTIIEAGQTTTAFALFTPTADRGRFRARRQTEARWPARPSTARKWSTRRTAGLPKLVEPGDLVTRTSGKRDRHQAGPGDAADGGGRAARHSRAGCRWRCAGLPHGVRVLNIGLNGILITERDTRREVVLYAEPWVKPMERPIVVLARSEAKNTEHAAKAVILKVAKP